MITTDTFKLEYVYAGLFSADSLWIHPTRTETTYELIYVLSGKVYMEESGTRYVLSENDAVILKPGCVHFGYKESEPPVSFYWIHFRIDSFKSCGIQEQCIRNFTNSFIFKSLLHAANHPRYPTGSAEAILLTLLNELAFFTNDSGSDEYKMIREAAEWIRINSASKKIYADEIAEKYNKNPQYFSRIFKKQYNIGLKEYICQERLNAAKSYLSNTNLSIKEIASLMNYESENEFINYFKYHQKTSPRKFRNSYSYIHMNNK